MRLSGKGFRRLAVVLAGVLALAPLSPVRAAAPDVLPLNVTNDSGRAGQVHLYVVGVNTSTGRLGYVDASGTFTPWPAGSIPPSPAPDVSIGGPANGATTTLRIPRGLSGRVYFSFGEKIGFFLTPTGLVQPAPWNPGDANHDVLFDWSEFTYNDDGLWLNSSQVDMFSVPHSVAVTNAAGTTTRTGVLVPDGRERIFNAIQGQAGDWSNLITTRPDGLRLRVLSPAKGIGAGVFDPGYLDGYIGSAWDTYRSQTLTVVPFQHEPGKRFTGRTDANGVMRFTDGTGTVVASFQKPATKDVFGCDGRLHAPNDGVVGPIARTLCAALHRSTLGYLHTQPTYDPGRFYTREITNHYSRIVHANMADGRAYGFPFDDVGGFESLVHDGDPASAAIGLTPW
ncbi:beta-1,3-glucanase family protein [Actinomadura sp. 7K507]|uniref:beta-1,3-glucanase family protein n=1 Tax=Actinomadura sp. 7K507 TaxID=2530365 RepID=UPI00104687A4|nr:beta-1,3-glucanase family protein [Actinomadura sp. 7K507]TDC97166.1 sugar hydrolase [Actinomadura sp. 7K507]